jgi:NAD(P)H-flavin reductase
MQAFEGELLEIRFEAGRPAFLINCPRSIQPRPGQYLQANSSDRTETLPISIFPASLPSSSNPATMEFSPAFPTGWRPGDGLYLRGPLGNGFTFPSGFSRVALVACRTSPAPLFPIARLAVEQGAEVAFFSDEAPSGLAAEVEVLPLALLRDARQWAETLYAVFSIAALAELRRNFGLNVHQRFQQTAQALVIVPMPCGGIAECGICGVPTSRGWKYACSHGPVFDLNVLDLI